MPKAVTLLVFPDDEKMYVELESFIEFLRDINNQKKGDELYNKALVAVADYLESKKNEFLADHILNEEAQAVKDKDRLN